MIKYYFIAAVLLSGCSSSADNLSSQAGPTDIQRNLLSASSTVVNEPQQGSVVPTIIKHTGKIKEGMNEAAVKKIVTAAHPEVFDAQINVSLSDMGYARKNLDVQFQDLTDESPIYIANINGDIQSRMPATSVDDSGNKISERHYSSATLVIDAENGLIIRSTVRP